MKIISLDNCINKLLRGEIDKILKMLKLLINTQV